jgi:hypothetical protein
LFDGADASSSTAQRYTTTVPTQALFFLNDPFIHTRAAHLTDKVLTLPDDRARQQRLAALLFGRSATPAEQALCSSFREAYARKLPSGTSTSAARERSAWAAWVRVLFASNEFLHVD